MTVPWAKVLHVEHDYHAVVIHSTNRKAPLEFQYNSRSAAELAHAIVVRLWKSARRGPEQERRRPPRHAVKVADLPPDADSIDLGTGRGYSLGIVGESRRQAELRRIAGSSLVIGNEVVFRVELVLEPHNPFDPNAVKVCTMDGTQLGYLSKEDAADYQFALKAVSAGGKRPVVRAKLIGGTEDKPSIGVIIDLAPPSTLVQRFGEQPF